MPDNQNPKVQRPAHTMEMLELEVEELRAQVIEFNRETVFVRELLSAAGVIAPASATIGKQVAIFIAQQLNKKGI